MKVTITTEHGVTKIFDADGDYPGFENMRNQLAFSPSNSYSVKLKGGGFLWIGAEMAKNSIIIISE